MTTQEKEGEEEIKLLQPYDDLPSTDDAKALRCYKFNVSDLPDLVHN